MKNKEDTSKMLEQHMLNQQLQNLQQQLTSLTQQIGELEFLSSDLNSLENQENSKTFSPLGGGIFVESEIKKSSSVLLSIGSNILVKKPKKEAMDLVKKQINQLKEIKLQLESELNKLSLNMMPLK